jgi:phosphatidylglycerophosphate synthase
MSLCFFRSLSTWSIQLQMGRLSSLLQWSNSQWSIVAIILMFMESSILFFRLNADELYKISLQEISSSRSEDTMLFVMCCLFICSLSICNVSVWLVLSLLRLLTEVHIRTYEAHYNREVSQNQNEKINALLVSVSAAIPTSPNLCLIHFK